MESESVTTFLASKTVNVDSKNFCAVFIANKFIKNYLHSVLASARAQARYEGVNIERLLNQNKLRRVATVFRPKYPQTVQKALTTFVIVRKPRRKYLLFSDIIRGPITFLTTPTGQYRPIRVTRRQSIFKSGNYYYALRCRTQYRTICWNIPYQPTQQLRQSGIICSVIPLLWFTVTVNDYLATVIKSSSQVTRHLYTSLRALAASQLSQQPYLCSFDRNHFKGV